MENKAEIKELADYLKKINDKVPFGLSRLKDTLTFAEMDLRICARLEIGFKKYDKALAFARSIPKFEDLESEEFIDWKLDDVEHLKYWE